MLKRIYAPLNIFSLPAVAEDCSLYNNNQEFVNTLLKRLVKLNYIKPGDVPNIDLYMDQVTTFMDEHNLKALKVL